MTYIVSYEIQSDVCFPQLTHVIAMLNQLKPSGQRLGVNFVAALRNEIGLALSLNLDRRLMYGGPAAKTYPRDKRRTRERRLFRIMANEPIPAMKVAV